MQDVQKTGLTTFLDLALKHIDHTLQANRRDDHLYHAYNILNIGTDDAGVDNLYEMLEGQVSILSSGLLSAEESLQLLKALRQSALYRADQHSYILYPDRKLPGFLKKNVIPAESIAALQLPKALKGAQNRSLLVQDSNGDFHFNGNFRNIEDVNRELETLQKNEIFGALVSAEADKIRGLFEETFQHAHFTGRSGTFFAFEGLGSIYWHMVSKLLLAVQENVLWHSTAPQVTELIAIYRDIQAGLGFQKEPAVYGAFPTDPYSHTPKGKGAKQPGMTGAVKEEILTRAAELGLLIENGELRFEPLFLDQDELLKQSVPFSYIDVSGNEQRIDLEPGSLAYTICQVPVIVQKTNTPGVTVFHTDGTPHRLAGMALDSENSRHIFQRDGKIRKIVVQFNLAS
jgi:hypothetical protein